MPCANLSNLIARDTCTQALQHVDLNSPIFILGIAIVAIVIAIKLFDQFI